MEGKLTYQRTLSAAETERVFTMIKSQRDQFISIDYKHNTDHNKKPFPANNVVTSQQSS